MPVKAFKLKEQQPKQNNNSLCLIVLTREFKIVSICYNAVSQPQQHLTISYISNELTFVHFHFLQPFIFIQSLPNTYFIFIW